MACGSLAFQPVKNFHLEFCQRFRILVCALSGDGRIAGLPSFHRIGAEQTVVAQRAKGFAPVKLQLDFPFSVLEEIYNEFQSLVGLPIMCRVHGHLTKRRASLEYCIFRDLSQIWGAG